MNLTGTNDDHRHTCHAHIDVSPNHRRMLRSCTGSGPGFRLYPGCFITAHNFVQTNLTVTTDMVLLLKLTFDSPGPGLFSDQNTTTRTQSDTLSAESIAHGTLG